MAEGWTTSGEAAAYLRALGWVVVPPAPPNLPEPEVGQVWRSPKPRVEPRTVVKIGPGRGWRSDTPCVFYSVPSDSTDLLHCLKREVWDAWVRKAAARPE